MRAGLDGSWRSGLMVVVAVVGFAACKVGNTQYSNSPDSGKVAPATRIDTTLTRTIPDSTRRDTAKKRP
jgi:hypothetical protein